MLGYWITQDGKRESRLPIEQATELAFELGGTLREHCSSRCLDDSHDRACTVSRVVHSLTGVWVPVYELCEAYNEGGCCDSCMQLEDAAAAQDGGK